MDCYCLEKSRGRLVVRHLCSEKMNIRTIIKSVIPKPVLARVQQIKLRRRKRRAEKRTPRETFSDVYRRCLWGKPLDPSRPFFSGSGSHDETIVSAYVDAVRTALDSLPAKPSAVDLGCGDFSVGARIRPMCAGYIACDVVPALIEHNRQVYGSLDVDFRVLDMVSDDLPQGDIAFIRQVIQHLSNRQIASITPKLAKNFDYLVLTEHLPATRDFVPNLDTTSPDIRLGVGSGVVLTEPPFNLAVMDARVLCEAAELGGIIRTTMYRLR